VGAVTAASFSVRERLSMVLRTGMEDTAAQLARPMKFLRENDEDEWIIILNRERC
jgi:hypothetical protein